MEKITKYCLLLIVAFTIMGCEPEFSLNAPYRDVTVAYCVLNSSDSIQYAQVYKGFQSQGNPADDAMIMDSIYYFDKVEVSLHEFFEGRLQEVIPMDTTTALPKNEGIFANPTQLLYYTTAEIDPECTYKLHVLNKETNKEVYGETPIVGEVKVEYPYGTQLNLSGKSHRITITHAPNSVANHVIMNFYYLEKSKSTGQIVKKGKISRVIITNGWRETYGDALYYDFDPTIFYLMINSELAPNQAVTRYPDYTRLGGDSYVEFEVWSAEKVLLTYLDLNNPSTSIVQDRIEYTNMVCPTDDSYKTAYGFVSSRSNAMKSFYLNDKSQDSLVNGSHTRDLGFEYLY